MLERGFQGKGLRKDEAGTGSVAQVVFGDGTMYVVGACRGSRISLSDVGMVHIVFDKEGRVPAVVEKGLMVGETDDVLCQHVVRRFEVGIKVVISIVARPVH